MILTYHSNLTKADIRRECRANAKVIDEIFNDPVRTDKFLRKVGILPSARNAKSMPGKTPKPAAAR